LWRDLGYAIGAILTGIIADLININASIIFIGMLTLASAFIIRYRMTCRTDGSLKIWDWITNKHKQHVATENTKVLSFAALLAGMKNNFK